MEGAKLELELVGRANTQHMIVMKLNLHAGSASSENI